MDDGRLSKRVMFGTIKDGVKKGRGGQESGWHAWKATPRCPELDRNSHRGKAEVYDRVRKEEEEMSKSCREKRTTK